MNLPQIPYAMRKNRTQEITTRGLNLSASATDGDLSDSNGVSTIRYPYLTKEQADGKLENQQPTVSMTRFGQELATVGKDNSLNIAGKGKGELSGENVLEDGRRQMATVNSKLVVFPDRQYYDSSVPGATVKNLYAETQAAMLFSSASVSLLKGVEGCIYGYGGSLKDNEFKTEPDSEITYSKFDVVAIGQTSGKDKLIGLLDLDEPVLTVSEKEDLGRVDTYTAGVNFISYNCYATDHTPVSGRWCVYLKASKHSDFYIVEESYYDMSATTPTSRHVSLKLSLAGAPGYEVDFSDLSGKISFYDPSRPQRYPKEIDGTFIRYNGTSVHRIHKLNNLPGICSIEDADDKINRGLHYGAGIFEWALWKEGFSNFAEGDRVTLFYPDVPYLATGTVKDASQNTIIFSNLGKAPWLAAESGKELVYLLTGNVAYADLSEFKAGDVVETSGITIDGVEANNTAFTIKSIDGATIHTTSDAFTEGVANIGVGSPVGTAKLERRIPHLDFICEANNRLYGCSNEDNTIYVSALGDPTNMFAYEGVSTDSYAVAVADKEPFTGCCRYGTDVLFFKENKIYKLMGSYPAEFALYSYDVEGVEEGSHGSLCVISEVLYYKGIHGIYAYTGGVPTFISQALGDGKYTEACAGTDGVSYLLSMKDDEKGVCKRFSYNPRLGIWMAEGEGERRDVVRIGDKVYYLCDKTIYEKGVGDVDGEWLLQFAPIYETIEGKKSHSRLFIRAEVPRGSYMRIEMRCDGGAWMEAGKIVGKHSGVVPIRIPVNRCDKFELRLSGKGPFTILSMQREYYVGSEK